MQLQSSPYAKISHVSLTWILAALLGFSAFLSERLVARDLPLPKRDDAPLVILARILAKKPIWLDKINNLASKPTTDSGPVIDVKQVTFYLEKSFKDAREGLMQSENDPFVRFKYETAFSKVALARSALTRATTPILIGGQPSPETLERVKGLSDTLQEIYETFGKGDDGKSSPED